jgi:PST family polysaccharide transporter
VIERIKKISQHNVAKNSIALFSLQIVSIVAPLIVLPYLSRVLGIEGFGVLMLAMSASAIGLIITDYGFNLSATFTISKNRENIEYISKLIGAIFVIKLTLALFFLLFIFIYAHFVGFGQSSVSIPLLIGVNVLVQVFIPTWFYQGIERMKNVTVYMVFAKISYVVLVYVFIKNNNDVDLVIFLLAVSNALAASVAVKFIYKNGYSIKKPDINLIKSTFKYSSQFFFSRAAVSIYTSASTFLVGTFAGIQQAAIYGASEKLYQASQSVTAPISQALFPYMAKNNNEQLLFRMVTIIGIPLTLGCLLVGIWANEIMVLIFGNDFSNAGQILQIFLIITIINFIAVNFGYPAFAGIGKIYLANYSVIIGAFIQLICLSLLYIAQNITALTVVISVFITELIVTSFRVYQYFKGRTND